MLTHGLLHLHRKVKTGEMARHGNLGPLNNSIETLRREAMLPTFR